MGGLKQNDIAIRWLSLLVFLLFLAPKANIRLGPVPVYFIDFILFFTFLSSRRIGVPIRTERLRRFVVWILICVLLSEFLFAVSSFNFLNTIYIVFRTTLSFSVFFSVRRILVDERAFKKLLFPMFLGTSVTALFLVLSSVPFTRFLITPFFSMKFLDPASDSIVGAYSNTDQAMRGRSLVGVSILSGAFVNIAWPLLLYIKNFRNGFLGRLNMLLPFTLIIIPFGVFMTYSRGAILGSIFVIFVTQVFSSGKYRSQFLVLLLVGFLVVNFVGLESDLFYTERLVQSTNRAINEGFNSKDERETERFMAYIEPFKHLINNPGYLFCGEGLSSLRYEDVIESDLVRNNTNRADHAVFAKAYYAYGFVAALLYVFLILRSILVTYRNCFYKNNPQSFKFARLLLASLAGMSTWLFFGHAVISQPRGAIIFYFVIGLVESQRNIYEKSVLHRVA